MAQAPQAAMEQPQQGGSPFSDPNTMAIYEQMRQSVSPKEFGDEVLAGASQVDPQAVAAFKAELDQIEMPPEALDLLNNMVDEILANPEKYEEIRAKYAEMGAPDEILPEQFDAQFFAALNMAVDQMIGAPAGEQAFARGGIAELKPVSKAIANYGRNGDTMLAHITPAEARMLRRKGGSGTINPKTGMPEFFNLFKEVGNAFKSVGNAVKSFTSSTVGRLVTGLAVGFFLGPAAVAAFGATAGTVAAAAITGFTASAGSSLLAGDGLKNALKQGVVGAISGGALQGVGSAIDPKFSLTGQAPANGVNPTAMEALTGQYNKVFGAPQISSTGQVAGMASVPDNPLITARDAYVPPPTQPSLIDQAKDIYNNKLFPSDIQSNAAGNAIATVQKTFPATAEQIMNAPAGSALAKAYSAAMPGIFSTYAPITAASLGVMGLAGGFKSTPADASEIKSEMLKPATQRIAEKKKQKEYYIQNLPGVKYDEFGAPVYGKNNPWPTTPASTTPTSNFDLPSTIGGIGSLYTPPPGTMGAQSPIVQPYNTASMYTNLMPPRRFADGGDVEQSPESAAMINAQRAAMIAQAQALGQTGYTPSSPGNYGVERGVYTPSTGFAQFTQQYMKDNPAASSAQNTSSLTNSTTPVISPPVDSTYTAPVTYNPPVDTYQPPVDTYQPPVDTYEPPNDTYVDDPSVTARDAYVPPTDTYVDDPSITARDAYVPPMDTYVDDPSIIARDAYVPPMDTYQTPQDTYQPPENAYMPPMDNYQPTIYDAPVDTYQPSFNASGDGAGMDGGYGGGFNNSFDYTGGGYDNNSFMDSQFNMGGIASLRSGGYPRRTGQISGPGTETSDSIPAMLSDGEFVMTAKAVRGAGKGDKRAGAKRMYALMHQLEQNAARG